MRWIIQISLAVILCMTAYFTAQQKRGIIPELDQLQVGLLENDVKNLFGEPLSKEGSDFIYVLNDSAELVVSFQSARVSSATLRYHHPLKVTDAQMKKLSLVQIAVDPENRENPSWFYAGIPAKGQIWKITSEGFIQTRTWVAPFSILPTKAKGLQALFNDFRTQRNLSM